jgi:homoserine O-acetyltransferase
MQSMIHGAAAKIQAAGGVRTLAFDATAPLHLSSGEILSPLTIAFESYGALNAERSNAVLICHGLTADQFVAAPNPVTGRPAWWPRIVGPGRPIDTNRFYVVCANVLGGSMGTTGPASLATDGAPHGLRFPPINIADMVRAQSMLIEALDIDSLFLVMGPGFGGMQALQWASAYPKRVFACATVASGARQTAAAMALSELSRQAIMADPEWRGGGYLAHGVRPTKGLSVARTASQIGNLSEPSLRDAFSTAASKERFALASQLAEARPNSAFVDRFDANSYLYLSRAGDAFDLGSDFGGNLSNAFSHATTRHCVFSFSSDWRFPPEEGRRLARALLAAGADAAFIEIDSDRGHDAHLEEDAQFEAALTGFVDAAAAVRGLSLQAGI